MEFWYIFMVKKVDTGFLVALQNEIEKWNFETFHPPLLNSAYGQFLGWFSISMCDYFPHLLLKNDPARPDRRGNEHHENKNAGTAIGHGEKNVPSRFLYVC